MNGVSALVFASLLGFSVRLIANEDPPGCSLASGGAGNTSQGGINFSLSEAHLGDTVPVFPGLGMASGACKATNVTGAIYLATGLLTNFLVDITLIPGVLVSCPVNGLCEPGPYGITLTPDLIGAGVNTPNGSVPGAANTVRAVENGFGTVLVGESNDQMWDFHSASIRIVTPCIQVFKTCDLLLGQGCFPADMLVGFRGYVTNCGDISLTNVMVVDDRAGQMQLYNPTNGLALTNNVILPPGAYAVFSNSFLPALQEICAGRATNSVTATATDTTTIGGPRASVANSDTGVCEICVNPAIGVTIACPPGAVAPGGVLSFSGTVTNAGNITLTNVTVVSDRLLTNGDVLVASFPTLANGEFRTFDGSYVVPTNVCSITDTLTVQGTPLCGGSPVTNTASATCAVNSTLRLSLTLECPATPPAPGQLMLLTGTITNLGDAALTNIWMVNHQPTNDSPVTVVPRLEPGEGMNYSASYLVPTNVCSFTSSLTASGFDVCGTVVTTDATRSCPVANPPPPILCATNKTVGTQTAWTFDPPGAQDSVDVTNVTITIVNTQTNMLCVDTFIATRTWRVTDGCGNFSECSQTVTVIDQTPPVITCSSNLVLAADAGQRSRSNVTFTVTATDNCGVTNLVTNPSSGNTFPVGVTTVTNTATDASGNQSICTFTVTVPDQQSPAIICPPDLTVYLPAGAVGATNLTLGTPATADNCLVTGVSNDAPAALFPGTNVVRWTVTDGSGNTSSCQQHVVVRRCSAMLRVMPLADQISCPSQAVVFEATASSPEPISYQWRFNGHPIQGQTNRTLKLGVAPGAGVYSVEVRTLCDAVTNSATLTMLSGPVGSAGSYTNTSVITINDDGAASPYVSVIPPNCVPGVVQKITVSILGFSHNYPSDVTLMLISPEGRRVKLMSGAGGSAGLSGGVNLTFSDAATSLVPEDNLIVSGTYLPTDYLPGLPSGMPPPAAEPYSTSLASLIGAEANGPWGLCVFDGSALDGGSISAWSLTIEWRDRNLWLRNPKFLATGEFRMEVLGQTGLVTILERSANLVTWLPVVTNVLATSPGVLVDPAPLYPYRFYRAMQP